ncbi:MAG TPA: hypothetical protein VJH03_04050 [Blastocatellia bacterium]|nr:hypothetical protein [Blastocatellia bacterium]
MAGCRRPVILQTALLRRDEESPQSGGPSRRFEAIGAAQPPASIGMRVGEMAPEIGDRLSWWKS